MAERRARRVAGQLSQGAFTLQRKGPRLYRVLLRVLVCGCCAAAGAAAVTAWQAWRAAASPDRCSVAPVDEQRQQTELTRARLALAEQSAARAAVQAKADQAAAEVARLSAELRFLRGQSDGHPTAAAATPRH